MNIDRARQILHDVAHHLNDPIRAEVFLDASSVDVQMITSDGHIWTLSLHDVDPGDVLANGKVVQTFGGYGNNKGRVN